MQEEFAELKIGDKTYKLPVKHATIGHSVIDISKLYEISQLCTFDPAFMSTASCSSRITYIDGEKGILRYRGYDIKILAEQSNFLETSYLLLYGELPTLKQQEHFFGKISAHSLLNEKIRNILTAFHYSAHPMAVIMGTMGCLSGFYHDCLNIHDQDERDLAVIRIIAKMPTIAAMVYKHAIGQPFIYPKNSLGFVENFLHMMFATPCEEYKVNPVIINALDKIFLLHADHEQNASTSTIRTVGSSEANPFACISAGIASLWGPSHGGANEAVINMLREIKTPDRIAHFVAKAKDKNDPFKLMGFGHRVYKNYDPRAIVLKEICKQVLDSLNQKNNNLLKIALELEAIALSDEYFIERKLYPNVDFYSGIIYEAIGIPSQMFTVLFSIARTVGWMSQWKEMVEDGKQKIYRPRQLYHGDVLREFVDIQHRP